MKKTRRDDTFFMRKALGLAKKGERRAPPNPMVGALLVKNGRIIGRGFHEYFGGPHAEINAIRSARGQAKGGTLYVTLEPCAHFGKTPPCVDSIVKHGIKEVVVGVVDPNPLVSGKGIRTLRDAGLRIKTGVLRRACETLNQDFMNRMRKRRPYVIIKAAQSLDGKIATKTGESRWISGKLSREFSRRLRAESDAILVGVRTILCDDPQLSVRHQKNGHQPARVVLDSRLRVSPQARIFSKNSGGPVIVAVTKKAAVARRRLFSGRAEILEVKENGGRVDLRSLLSVLAMRGISRVLIEGGGEVIAQAFSDKLVDEIYLFTAPIIIGGRQAINSVAGNGVLRLKDAVKIKQMHFQRIGQDLLIRGRL